MNRMRGLCISGSALVAVLVVAAPARAELYKDVARGLALLDFSFSGERNVLGDGLTVNAGAMYSNRRFDFGLADLTLTGVVSSSFGYTKRGIPGADFSLNTGGTSLAYTFNARNGGQNLSATGNVLINVETHINALGFYDETIQISNRGTYESTGLAGDTTGPVAFDVGPIDKSGNLYIDLLAKLAQPLFEANNLENPFAKFSQQSMKLTNATKTVADLQARAVAGEYLTDQELSSLINSSILAAVLGGEPSSNLLNSLTLKAGETGSGTGQTSTRFVPTPEPASVSAFVVGLAMCFCRRRRIS